jgi:hypothetical protein
VLIACGDETGDDELDRFLSQEMGWGIIKELKKGVTTFDLDDEKLAVRLTDHRMHMPPA